jgi:hypothetical protein
MELLRLKEAYIQLQNYNIILLLHLVEPSWPFSVRSVR